MNAAIRLFVALLLAKPLIVIAVRLGAALVVGAAGAGEPQATFTDALLGVAIILLAGLLPGVIYRFSGGLMTTQAGTAPRASGGFSEQSGHAAVSAADSAWALAQLNPMPPLTVKPSTGVGAGAARWPGPGLRAVPAAAGAVGRRPWRPRVVGGAVESGGRWLAGQAATAGGVLGDVEAPRIPAPPVPRHGRYGTPAPGGAPDHAPAPPAPDHPGRSGGDTGSVTITITPDGPGRPAASPVAGRCAAVGDHRPGRTRHHTVSAPGTAEGAAARRERPVMTEDGRECAAGAVRAAGVPRLAARHDHRPARLGRRWRCSPLTRILDTGLPGWVRLGWVGVAAACLTVAFLPFKGRTIVEYLPVVANFWLQRVTGHDVYRGGPFRLGATQPAARFVLPGDLGHLQLLAFTLGSTGATAQPVTRSTGRRWRWCRTRRRRPTRRCWRWRGRRSPCWSRRCAAPGWKPGGRCWRSCARRTR